MVVTINVNATYHVPIQNIEGKISPSALETLIKQKVKSTAELIDSPEPEENFEIGLNSVLFEKSKGRSPELNGLTDDQIGDIWDKIETLDTFSGFVITSEDGTEITNSNMNMDI